MMDEYEQAGLVEAEAVELDALVCWAVVSVVLK